MSCVNNFVIIEREDDCIVIYDPIDSIDDDWVIIEEDEVKQVESETEMIKLNS